MKASAEDMERLFFLAELDAAEFEVTDWEAQFIANLISQPRPLSPAQRAVIEQLKTKYQERI